MGRKSRAKQERRKAQADGVNAVLGQASFESMATLLDAASVSPTSSQRMPSLAVLFEALVKRSRSGSQDVTAEDLQSFVLRVERQDPTLASLEDFVPLDLRLEVDVPWFGELFTVAPGGLERPVAIIDFHRLLAEVIDPVVVPRLGYGLRDVGEVILKRVDAVVRVARAAWQIDELPHAGDPAIVSPAEVAAVSNVGSFEDMAQMCTSPRQALAAIEALCVPPSKISANDDVLGSAATFGVALGVSRAGQRIPLSAGFLIEALPGIGANLAAAALLVDPRVTNNLWASVGKQIALRLGGAGTRVAGTVDVGDGQSVHSLVQFGERQVVALDLVVGLSARDLLARMPSEDNDPLDKVAPGATVDVGGAPVVIPDDAVVARGRVFAVPEGVGMVGGGNAPLLSLADFEWIVHSAQETPDDLWAFLLELAQPRTPVSFAWDMIDRWEVWRDQRAFSRSGIPPTAIMFAPHAAEVEWEEAARATPAERALHALGMREIRSWPVRVTSTPDVAELLDLKSDEAWTVLPEPFPIAIAKSDSTGRGPHDDTVWNLSNAVAWKIEHCARVVSDAAQASGLKALIITFSLADREDGEVLTAAAGDAATRLTIEWDARLAGELAADAAACEARIGHLFAAKFAPEYRDSVHAAWRSAPPGIRMDSYSVRQRISELPAPLTASLVARSTVLTEFAAHVAAQGAAPGLLHGVAARDFESKLVFPWLLARLHQQVANLEPDNLLSFGLAQLERAHHQRSMAERKLAWQLGFPEHAPEGIDDRREHAANSTRAISLLVEEVLANPPAGQARTESLAWTEALAIAELCVGSCMRSGALHHRLNDASIDITGSYEVNVQHSDAATDIDFTRYQRERKSATRPVAVPIGASAGNSSEPVSDAVAEESHEAQAGSSEATSGDAASVVARLPELADIDRELRSALAFGIDALMGVLNVGAQWADVTPESATLTSSSAVVAECLELAVGGTESEYVAALDWVTLRAADLTVEVGKVIPHWENERRLKRLLTSPFVETTRGLWVLPWACEITLKVTANYLHDGRLPWPNNSLPKPVVQALDDYRKVRNKQLERDCADELDNRSLTVRTSVKKPTAYGMQTLSGEIDVLCADPVRGRLWVIEAKDPYTAFSAPQIRKLVDDFHEPKKYVDKLLGKVQDVKDSASSVAAALGVPDADRSWEVIPLMVTRHVEAAAFAVAPRVAFCTIDTIAEAVDSDDLPGLGWFESRS